MQAYLALDQPRRAIAHPLLFLKRESTDCLGLKANYGTAEPVRPVEALEHIAAL